MEVEEIGRTENYQKFERRDWHFYTVICPGSSLLPAEYGSAVPVTLLLRQWVLSYFIPLKISNIIFSNHTEEIGKQLNKSRKGLGKGVLSLVSEWLCNTYCWSVGLPRWYMCSRPHVFLANLAQVLRFGFRALRLLYTLFPCNTYSSWLNACAVLWNFLYCYEKEISYRIVTDWFSKWPPVFSLGVYFMLWMFIYQHQITSLHAVFPTSSQACYLSILKESAYPAGRVPKCVSLWGAEVLLFLVWFLQIFHFLCMGNFY